MSQVTLSSFGWSRRKTNGHHPSPYWNLEDETCQNCLHSHPQANGVMSQARARWELVPVWRYCAGNARRWGGNERKKRRRRGLYKVLIHVFLSKESEKWRKITSTTQEGLGTWGSLQGPLFIASLSGDEYRMPESGDSLQLACLLEPTKPSRLSNALSGQSNALDSFCLVFPRQSWNCIPTFELVEG